MARTLWRATAPDGLAVHLQDAAWDHIRDAHPAMWRHQQRIRETIERPSASKAAPGRKRYYYRAYHDLAKGQDGILVIVVVTGSGRAGYVATAFACEAPSWVEPKGLD